MEADVVERSSFLYAWINLRGNLCIFAQCTQIYQDNNITIAFMLSYLVKIWKWIWIYVVKRYAGCNLLLGKRILGKELAEALSSRLVKYLLLHPCNLDM